MENKMFNVPVEVFQLDKVTINKQNVCKVSFRITSKTEVITDVLTFKNVEPNYSCNETLRCKIIELKPFLCNIHKIMKDEIARSKVQVVGIEMSGFGDKATFKIHGKQESDSNQSMNFATCKVIATGGNYGFEVDVENIIEDLRILTHRYIFEYEKDQPAFGLNSAKTEDKNEGVEDADVVDENNTEE